MDVMLYDIWHVSGIQFVALRCTFTIVSMSLTECGAYSSSGLTRALYKSFKRAVTSYWIVAGYRFLPGDSEDSLWAMDGFVDDHVSGRRSLIRSGESQQFFSAYSVRLRGLEALLQ